MLTGNTISLRPVLDRDVEQLYTHHVNLANRGDYFPRGIVAQPIFRRRFEETGYWTPDEGMLVIVSPSDEVLGHIEFFKTVNYLDEFELSYQIYAQEHRRQGAASEAVRLLVRYLFDTKPVNRIRLVIHPENAASRRLAEKCGFRHEGTARGAWFNAGRHHDVEIYALVRADGLPG